MDDFIFPFFVYEDRELLEKSLKIGHMNTSKVHVDNIPSLIEKVAQLGISQILLFGVPKKRDFVGSSSFLDDGVIQRSIRLIKQNFGSRFSVFSDVCLCQYNDSGHCGIPAYPSKHRIYKSSTEPNIDNDKTLQILGKVSLSHCESGVDFIAPSSMMDGQVYYLRKLLDSKGYIDVKILSYSSKHNSCLYSPFRSSNYSKVGNIEKSNYQIPFTNPRESLREILLDIEEGADWVMVKPSLWYMDLIKYAKELIRVPLVVQNVSGEYTLMKEFFDRTINEVKNMPDLEHFPKSDDFSTQPMDTKHLNRSFNKDSKTRKKKFLITRSSSKVSNFDLHSVEMLLRLMESYKRAGADKIISYFIFELFGQQK